MMRDRTRHETGHEKAGHRKDGVKEMETQIRRLDYDQIDEQIIEEAGNIIQKGGLVAFPTETVYGLGGDALNPESSKKDLRGEGKTLG